MLRTSLHIAVVILTSLLTTPIHGQLAWINGKSPESVAIDLSPDGNWHLAVRTVTPGHMTVLEILRLQAPGFPFEPIAFHADHRGTGWELEKFKTSGELACIELRFDVGYASSREILWRAEGRELKSLILPKNEGLWAETPDSRLLRLQIPFAHEEDIYFELLEFNQRGKIRRLRIPYRADSLLPRDLGRLPRPGAFAELSPNKLLFLERIAKPFVDSFLYYQPRDHVVWWVVNKQTGESMSRGVCAIDDCSFGSFPGHLQDGFRVVGMDSASLSVLVEKDLIWMNSNSRRDCDTTQSFIALLRFTPDGDIVLQQESTLPRLVRREFTSSPSAVLFLPCTAPQRGIIGGRVYSVGINGEFSTYEY